MKIKTQRGIYTGLLAMLVFGAVVGIMFPELFRMCEGTYAGAFGFYGRKKLQEMSPDLWSILGYLLVCRLRLLLFLWMSCYTPAGLWLHLLFSMWLGCSGGMLLALFALRQGIQGVGLFFCCMVPQWIFYVLQWKKELQIFLAHYLPGETYTGNIVLPYPRRKERMAWITMVLYCISGCAAETFVGLWSIKIFMKNLI